MPPTTVFPCISQTNIAQGKLEAFRHTNLCMTPAYSMIHAPVQKQTL
ncbi:hypothetical protein [Chitinophaga silvisoli]|nr:hypothetical protein [Chitinophaga silvisoli]